MFVIQIGEEKATVIAMMRKAISQQFTDEVRLSHFVLGTSRVLYVLVHVIEHLNFTSGIRTEKIEN